MTAYFQEGKVTFLENCGLQAKTHWVYRIPGSSLSSGTPAAQRARKGNTGAQSSICRSRNIPAGCKPALNLSAPDALGP